MTKAEFMRRMMMEAAEHWEIMKDAFEDDSEFLNPEAMPFEGLAATLFDCRMEYWKEEAQHEAADKAIINARLANPYR